jgi:hypothetical protein
VTPSRAVQRAAAAAALLFGLATIWAGVRVLSGQGDPGYVVFRPLLIFNTVMGVAYLGAGVTIWRSLWWGRTAAAAILTLNLIAAGTIALLYASGEAVAVDSVRAMGFRTAVWLALFVALVWLSRKASRGSAH